MDRLQTKTKNKLNSRVSDDRSLYEKCFCDESGKLTLAQSPNLPIIIAACGWLLRIVFPQGMLAAVSAVIFFSSILWWCYLEIFRGTNYFRRFLGATVLVWVILNLIRVQFRL